MNALVEEYLQETNNDPHKAYDKYIAYHLLSGRPMPEDISGIKDFIKASKYESDTKKKSYSAKPKASITMTAEQIVIEIKNTIQLHNECMKWYKEKNDKEMYNSSMAQREAMRILLCRVTNTEYQYNREVM